MTELFKRLYLKGYIQSRNRVIPGKKTFIATGRNADLAEATGKLYSKVNGSETEFVNGGQGKIVNAILNQHTRLREAKRCDKLVVVSCLVTCYCLLAESSCLITMSKNETLTQKLN